MADIKVAGLRELNRALTELPKRITRRILWSGLMAAATPMVAKAKSLAPVLQNPDSRRVAGALKKAIRARPVNDRAHSATVVIGVRKLTVKQIAKFKRKSGKNGAKNPSDPFYWRFQEFPAAGKPLQRFLKPAFDAGVGIAAETARDKIRARIVIEAEKLGRGS